MVPVLGTHLVDKSRTAFYGCDAYLNLQYLLNYPDKYMHSNIIISQVKNYKLITNKSLTEEDTSIVVSSQDHCNNCKTSKY